MRSTRGKNPEVAHDPPPLHRRRHSFVWACFRKSCNWLHGTAGATAIGGKLCQARPAVPRCTERHYWHPADLPRLRHARGGRRASASCWVGGARRAARPSRGIPTTPERHRKSCEVELKFSSRLFPSSRFTSS